MSDNELNYAIHQARGYRKVEGQYSTYWVDAGGRMIESPPNYAQDLNAIREIELDLWDDALIEQYEEALKDLWMQVTGYSGAFWWMAPAKIKAEAVLKVLLSTKENAEPGGIKE